MLLNHINDELYHDLYFGDYMNIAEGEVITKNLPMDPVNFDWNEYAKNQNKLLKYYSKRDLWLSRISNWMFTLGFTVSAAALVLTPEKYNVIIFALYIVMFFVRKTTFQIKAKGRALMKDGTPIAFAIVRVCSAATSVEIAHKATDALGRFHVIIPNGNYFVKIEKKNDDGSYSLIHTSEQFEVKKGVVKKVFNV